MAAWRRLVSAPRQLALGRLAFCASSLASRVSCLSLRSFQNFSDSHAPLQPTHAPLDDTEVPQKIMMPLDQLRTYLHRSRSASEVLDLMHNYQLSADMAALAICRLSRLSQPEERPSIIRHEGFMALFKTLVAGSADVPIPRLGSVLHSLWRLGLQDPEMLTILPPADDHNFAALQVVMAKLVNAQLASQTKANELLELVARTSLTFNNIHIATALNRLARLATTNEERKRILRHPSFTSLVDMVKKSTRQTARVQASMLHSLAKLGLNDKAVMKQLVDNFLADVRAGRKRSLGDPKVVCSIMNGMAISGYNRPDLTEVVHQLLFDPERRLLMNFDEQSLCVTIQSLARLQADSMELMTLLVETALKRLSNMNGQHINMLVWGLSRRNYFRISWLQKIAEEVRKRAGTLKPVELSGVCMCFARVRTLSKTTMDMLADDIVRTRHLFKPRSMCNVLFAYSALEYFPPKLFEQLASHLSDLEATAPKESALLPIELIQIELTLSQLRKYYPEGLKYFSAHLIERARQVSQLKKVSLALPSRDLVDLDTYVVEGDQQEEMSQVESQGKQGKRGRGRERERAELDEVDGTR